MTNKYMKHNTGKKNKIFSSMIYIAFSLLFILMVQALPSFGVTTIALASSGPSIYFPEDSWDFGEITPDELPTHIFRFKNIGDEVLIIKGTRVSCESCIDPLFSTKELNPGEEGELKITVNSLDMIGRFTKRIYVESNDLDHPRTIITVSGFIRDSQQTPFTIGKYYFSRGEYDKAIIEFEKSIELDENHTESYYYLGQCYLQIGYIYETRSIAPFINEYNEALEYYLKALALDTVSESKNMGIYVYLNTRVGSIYFQKKDYLQAIEHLEKATGIFPYRDNVEAYYYLGLSYDKIGETEKAREYLSWVIELAPQSDFAQEAEKKLKKLSK
jgi:Flp pilus assembly protein TadD